MTATVVPPDTQGCGCFFSVSWSRERCWVVSIIAIAVIAVGIGLLGGKTVLVGCCVLLVCALAYRGITAVYRRFFGSPIQEPGVLDPGLPHLDSPRTIAASVLMPSTPKFAPPTSLSSIDPPSRFPTLPRKKDLSAPAAQHLQEILSSLSSEITQGPSFPLSFVGNQIPVSPIFASLFLGGERDFDNRSESYDLIISLIHVQQKSSPTTHVVLPLKDRPDIAAESSSEYHFQTVLENEVFFESLCDLVDYGLANKQKILIHCALGKNRSVSFLIAYLCRSCGITYEEGMRFLKSKRSNVGVGTVTGALKGTQPGKHVIYFCELQQLAERYRCLNKK